MAGLKTHSSVGMLIDEPVKRKQDRWVSTYCDECQMSVGCVRLFTSCPSAKQLFASDHIPRHDLAYPIRIVTSVSQVSVLWVPVAIFLTLPH